MTVRICYPAGSKRRSYSLAPEANPAPHHGDRALAAIGSIAAELAVEVAARTGDSHQPALKTRLSQLPGSCLQAPQPELPPRLRQDKALKLPDTAGSEQGRSAPRRPPASFDGEHEERTTCLERLLETVKRAGLGSRADMCPPSRSCRSSAMSAARERSCSRRSRCRTRRTWPARDTGTPAGSV